MFCDRAVLRALCLGVVSRRSAVRFSRTNTKPELQRPRAVCLAGGAGSAAALEASAVGALVGTGSGARANGGGIFLFRSIGRGGCRGILEARFPCRGPLCTQHPGGLSGRAAAGTGTRAQPSPRHFSSLI